MSKKGDPRQLSIQVQAKNEAMAMAQYQLLIDQARGQCPEVTDKVQWDARAKCLVATLSFPDAVERQRFEQSFNG
ncbi:hypothetical protein [Ferrimonas marina]|uniref:Uncharacterized protein n=1 Tax=Ferrimonas marina TaxID=299255 RepID=A0A1M5Z4C9_9GAMM|nr:hypothetical protein [Ferrimonas marina]SHI19126.1 hypothetical protein SAMN02745129_4630 [Ferrimonas marina]